MLGALIVMLWPQFGDYTGVVGLFAIMMDSLKTRLRIVDKKVGEDALAEGVVPLLVSSFICRDTSQAYAEYHIGVGACNG
jgi:hypothetical protein